MNTLTRTALFCLMALSFACGEDTEEPIDQTPTGPVYPLDDVLRFNHVQAKGTHNSYHLKPDRVLDDSHDYSHAPLDVQLAEQGVRQFELDLHLSVEGHFDVLHLPGIDDKTTCLRFTDCLTLIKTWSDNNPGHLPIMIWIEPKDDIEMLVADPQTIGYEVLAGHIAKIDDEIRSVLPPEKRFEPDDLRGDFSTLPEAIAAEGGWPTLDRMRNKFVFAMLDGGPSRDEYLDGHPALEGRAMFATANGPEDPWAALFKINNAVSDKDRIRGLIEGGFMVTSNIDGAGGTDEDDEARLQGSLDAGANFLSSDFPAPVDGRAYFADIPDGNPARCNPLSAPPECTSAALEDLPKTP